MKAIKTTKDIAKGFRNQSGISRWYQDDISIFMSNQQFEHYTASPNPHAFTGGSYLANFTEFYLCLQWHPVCFT